MQKLRIKNYNTKDTIAAIATYPASSALGVIKISGKKALPIISEIFISQKKKDIKKAKTHTLHYGWIKNGSQSSNGTGVLDEVLVSIMRSPSSYTKEDVVEISSHGGTLVLNKILERVLGQGARLALPGEFSYRAVRGGRIDLLQAESIRDIVDAKSEEGLRLAIRQLKGEKSKEIDGLKERLKELFVKTEALINFPEDEVNISLEKLKKELKAIRNSIDSLLAASQEAKILREGLKCVICGKTNAGKSTLFNCLLKEERVIVSRYAGTTRDVVEETINIRGVPLRIYDTAGILEPKDLVSRKAIEKSAKTFNEADLIILVLDGSKQLAKDDYFLLERIKDKNAIFIINKSDLPQKIQLDKLATLSVPKVKMSALHNKGLKQLEEAVFKSVYKRGVDREDVIFLSHYQKQSLDALRGNILEAYQYMDKGYTIDFLNFALRESLDNLAKLSGKVLADEVLHDIFSNFCIGK
ncbi:MAG: tRNA uridine-5-carboxymethylaminomethyl(34) synthesis GTPase MnmE [Candidatus Omnitrophota bacterium]|nr:MAG: tRNA uridine-5-carboxymethylaminomethyl(34) synthesis GTPase MnmE [Candidatus Omnitrophota bacterium]